MSHTTSTTTMFLLGSATGGTLIWTLAVAYAKCQRSWKDVKETRAKVRGMRTMLFTRLVDLAKSMVIISMAVGCLLTFAWLGSQ